MAFIIHIYLQHIKKTKSKFRPKLGSLSKDKAILVQAFSASYVLSWTELKPKTTEVIVKFSKAKLVDHLVSLLRLNP